jgi:5'-nucleotidase
MINSSAKKSVLLLLVLTASSIASCGNEREDAAARTTTVSVIGTNDDHGHLADTDGNRGQALFGGYVNNLRELRDEDGGAVLLIGAGDMWQGTLESNLSEGASMVEAYNALGYTAIAIGNHEFDFGPVGDKAIPESDADDAQGALKQRATEAAFPFLAANLVDVSTGNPVGWPNVQPSVLLNVAGIDVGVVGIMSRNALSATISANVRGLQVAPLVPTIIREARALRERGAGIVIVTAHAGSGCESFDDPSDLSSCDTDGEIIQVARELPAGLVDQIVAGHVHQGIAHEVNGIAITSSFSNSRAFGRVDHSFDLESRTVQDTQIFPPQKICGFVAMPAGDCVAEDDEGATIAHYAGKAVHPDAAVQEIVATAAAAAERLKSESLGIYLETPITLSGGTDSALGNLVTDVLLASNDGDVVILNVLGGLRSDLPQGDLEYGDVYQVYPFDNRIVILQLTGAELRRVIGTEATGARRTGFAGMRVFVSCVNGDVEIDMQRADGSGIRDDEKLVVITTDFLALGGGGTFTPVTPEDGFAIPGDTPLVREQLVAWLRQRGGNIHADDFVDAGNPRWNVADAVSADCTPDA